MKNKHQVSVELFLRYLLKTFAKRTGRGPEKAAKEKTKGAEINYPQKKKVLSMCENTEKESLQIKALTKRRLKVSTGLV